MATPNRWAVRESGAATFFNLTTLKAVVTLNTLKTSSITAAGETVYARGGPGNSKLVGFSSNREAKLNLEDAIFDNEALAMLTGNTITTGAKEIDYTELVTVTSNAGTLTKTPATAGALTSVYEVNADGTNGTEIAYAATPATGQYKVVTKALTFYTGDLADASQVRVYYKVDTDATAKTVKVSSDAFGGTFRVVVDVLVRDEYTKADFQGQLIIPNGKFEDNFELSFSADGDPAILTLPIEILKPSTSTTMWELVIFDDALIT